VSNVKWKIFFKFCSLLRISKFYVNINLIQLCIVKVKTLWEGQNILKQSPLVLMFTQLSNVKACGRFFSNFLAYPEKLDFTDDEV